MLAEAISAGSSILGGIFGSREKEKDRKLQKEFAQSGIQWRVADAKAAGLHPLAALGAQTTSYAPVSVGGSDIGTGFAAAGQDLSRSINATRNSSQRVDAYTKTVQDLNVRRLGLENEMLASQIAKINQAGTPPALPGAGDRYLIDGQGNSPLVSSGEQNRTISAPGAGSQEPAAINEVGYARTPTGYAPVMSKDVKDRLEEDLIGMIMWNVRNRLAPTLGNHNAPAMPLGPKEYWSYHPGLQEYRRSSPQRGWRNPGFRYNR